jgi:hypothetical protein
LFYLFNNKIKTLSSDLFEEKVINRLVQTDNSNIIKFYSELTQPESVFSPCKCESCLCIPLGTILNQDTKCVCKEENSRDIYEFNNSSSSMFSSHSSVKNNSMLKIIGLLVFVVCFLGISVGFRLRPPRWLFENIQNTTSKIYSCKFRRRKNSGLTERSECDMSIQTTDSIIDVETEVILNSVIEGNGF